MVKMMIKEIGALVVDQTVPGTFTLNAAASDEGWIALTTGDAFVNEQILDLAGLSQQEKTIFFNGIAQQDSFNPAVVTGAAGDSLKIYDVISSVPISLDNFTLSRLAVYQNFSFAMNIQANLPTFEQTPYFGIREFTVDLDTANWGSMIQVSQNQLGSLQPTASDRLYCYRLVAIVNTAAFGASRFDVLPVRYVIGANPTEEKEYQYLMRLKKSYDLQQSFDVDGNRPH